ncbi:uncharacterized membrane protein YoaK (UPF0700 family) [Flavobacterium sp. 7E]|uniref:YoaK family protein n=1 Tax=Flavobacterium sp. 7E TaxID=2735898 RepID=UPI001570D48A|nr:YoaK family protein [Flavobacterium sp. 7E]NRS87808.1 uncharacterized membrane protein YoaK (UPF0700 family) [Flavobacterium sp. 7E]
MKNSNTIWYLTFVLTIIAGFCDTLTFVAADTIFSAHVTGNFIVFAYQIVKGYDVHAWIKLFTFPVFIAAVIIGGWIASKNKNTYSLLLWESVVLLLSGIGHYMMTTFSIFHSGSIYIVAMMVVFAMGLQNAFGKRFSKETFGPTTMMTGNVTQASLDIRTLMLTKFKDAACILNFKKQLTTIFGFLIGCCLGAFCGKQWGLLPILAPGLILLLCYFKIKDNQNSADEI